METNFLLQEIMIKKQSCCCILLLSEGFALSVVFCPWYSPEHFGKWSECIRTILSPYTLYLGLLESALHVLGTTETLSNEKRADLVSFLTIYICSDEFDKHLCHDVYGLYIDYFHSTIKSKWPKYNGIFSTMCGVIILLIILSWC